MANRIPNWNPRNLARHYGTRLRKDAGCFEDLLGIVARTMTELEYETRSEAAVTGSWAEYEGESRDVKGGGYYDAAAYFVDDDLVVAITDGFRNEFITCFHEHFGLSHAYSLTAPGSRMLRYQEHLKFEEQGRLIINVKRIRGFE